MPGRYDTVVMFGAMDGKAAMNMVLTRADRMDTGMLVAVPADAPGPAGPIEPVFSHTRPVPFLLLVRTTISRYCRLHPDCMNRPAPVSIS